ncbi:villin-3 [Daucus carota subsp. sativus]|uniref:villin-3 n=1 Tax=Daucus carota subsp. sativus TaxID=79200 RepID=UPI0030832442
MSSSRKALEPAFQGAGQKPGTEIWRIENFVPVALPKSDYGRFYSGDSYIVLQTSPGRGGAYLFDIHFWLGKDTSQDEAGTAAIKTVELDEMLGGRAVQHRELQGHESDKFLSYFKPCIIPLEGGVASGFKKPEEEEFETRLYVCKGKRAVRLKQVPFARTSLNHDDVFILDTEDKIFQFNGSNSNIQERAKALEVIQVLKEKYHEGTCNVAIVDDGKLKTESDSGEFWVLFGGFAPLGKRVTSEDDVVPERKAPELYSIVGGQVNAVAGELSKSSLANNKCFLLDCGAEVFVWIGRLTKLEDRKAAVKSAEDFIASQNRPKSTYVARLIQGHETTAFKAKFDSWPSGSAPSAPEEGRGRVAAFLKKQGVALKGSSKSASVKSAPVNEEIPPLLEGDGKTEVWHIEGSDKTPVPKEDIGKFYGGDCYIVLYTYNHQQHQHDKKEDYYLCYWIGKDSVEEDQKNAAQLTGTMSRSLKGRPVQGRIYQGKEPPQFLAIFQQMVVLKGGISSGYKNYIAEKGLKDETYSGDCVALIQILGTAVHQKKAVQVDAVATSMNTNHCFILQSGSTMTIWKGSKSTPEQQQLAIKVASFLKPGADKKNSKEGTEHSSFWSALGGRKSYTSEKESSDFTRDPHLFTFSIDEGKLEVREVYNFSQDDLLTEDVMILDSHAEVFVWVGQRADSKEKQNSLENGQIYIDMAVSLDELSPHVPFYKVTEGNEPCFFTSFFSWDPSKANAHGNSFQRKAMLLFGTGPDAETNDGVHTQRAAALAALNSAFNSTSETSQATETSEGGHSEGGHTQRAAALAALNSAFSSSSETSHATENKSNETNQGGHTQRAAALAALNAAFSSSSGTSQDKSKVTSGGGHTQRAAALAALNSAFSSSSEPKRAPSPKPAGASSGSQRAAAVAALSFVFRAKNKVSPPISPRQSSRNTPTEPVISGSSENLPEVEDPTETHTPTETQVEEAETVEPVKESNEESEPKPEPVSESNEETESKPEPVSESTEESEPKPEPVLESTEESEPKPEAEQDEENGSESENTYSYDRLKSNSDNPVTGIDLKRREAYLSDEEFETIFGMSKEAFSKFPRWKQDMLKKKHDLF